jgi:hypothetical protein
VTDFLGEPSRDRTGDPLLKRSRDSASGKYPAGLSARFSAKRLARRPAPFPPVFRGVGSWREAGFPNSSGSTGDDPLCRKQRVRPPRAGGRLGSGMRRRPASMVRPTARGRRRDAAARGPAVPGCPRSVLPPRALWGEDPPPRYGAAADEGTGDDETRAHLSDVGLRPARGGDPDRHGRARAADPR